MSPHRWLLLLLGNNDIQFCLNTFAFINQHIIAVIKSNKYLNLTNLRNLY
jgi:hypothetical protein